ncbi:hypothetical protein F0L17_10055 [Streptomyces sp. TRM43335]|uniref:Uncharacterized protein n=1 Tax=Streptomyces taklimakanensis TaxID=2569853 RepID=A0A6G2BB65_9ACTN|nr:hypothetical protein [Streptomyces taklimakanensis]MTE19464.1 hypothetical protein [Streptomyces taklimakanensis]
MSISAAAGPGPDHRDPVSALDFTDPLSRPSADDTDRGWGEGSETWTGSDTDTADLSRFLEERPPHHL